MNSSATIQCKFMKKIKICHFTVTHRATDNRIFHNECKALVKEGFDVSIIAPNADNEILENINIIGVKCNMHPISRVIIGSKKIYKKALEIDADIYHFHDIELFKYGVKLKKKGKKVIFDSHEDWLMYANDISWLPAFIKKQISKHILYLYKKHLKIFDAVITVSPHILVKLKKYSNHVFMITNYPKYNPNDEILFSKGDYLNRKNTLFYSGTVSNQEVILQAISKIPNIHYNIAGTFFEEYKEKLSKYPSWDRVNYLGYLSKIDLGKAFQKPTIAITLLHYNANVGFKQGTLGNTKFFEYLKYGLPIICTDFEIWKEMIIDKYKCGICVNPNNIEEVQQAIQYLIDNKEIAYQMGQNGLKAFKEEFNWSSQEQNLLNIYKFLQY